MKILCESYGSLENTQSSYLPKALASLGVGVALRGADTSLYSVMDEFNPDYYMVHIYRMEQALVQYVNDEDTPNIKLLLDCTGATGDHVSQLESVLKDQGLSEHVEFLYSPERIISTFKTVHIPECGDLELVDVESIKFNHKIEICNVGDLRPTGSGLDATSWHNVAISEKPVEGYDYALPIAKLTPLLKNYERVYIHTKRKNIPQLVYDAFLSGCEVLLSADDQQAIDNLCYEMLGTKLRRHKDQSDISRRIKEKHTPQHRAKTFLSQLKGIDL
tara:strand:- start:110 stop:934 length:825 start_codon:yes stop_codon:yes gene_type:complete